jgi:hypothetical protein
LLNPAKIPAGGPFPYKKEMILRLCEEAIQVARMQPSLLKLRQPIKVFGSLYGRYTDLLKFFDNFGTPEGQ